MAKFTFAVQLLLLTLMAPATAFGSVATGSISLQQLPTVSRMGTSASSPFVGNFRGSRPTVFDSAASQSSTTSMNMVAGISAPSMSLVSSVVGKIRGGAAAASVPHVVTPVRLFNTCLLAVALLTTTFKVLQAVDSKKNESEEVAAAAKQKPESVKSLQRRFLSVFWLLRCADWLQGPYFYEVYASKVFGGAPASMSMISRLFLTGFASTALFGPAVGRAIDSYGRKKGTLAFSILYAVGALSTKSPLLAVLLFGRVMSGIGTSLLFSAPESWLVGEAQKSGDDPDGEYLGETFGLVGFI